MINYEVEEVVVLVDFPQSRELFTVEVANENN